jgi:hypothetical protein
VSDRKEASKFYFENVSGKQYKIYCLDQGKQYLNQNETKLKLVDSETDATVFNSTDNADKFRPVPNTSGSKGTVQK